MDNCPKDWDHNKIQEEVKYDPRLDKFSYLSDMRDQRCENLWSVACQGVQNITRTSTQHNFWWFIHVWISCRNERIERKQEKQVKLINKVSGKGNGFMPYNW